MAKNEKDRPIVYVYLGALFLVFFYPQIWKLNHSVLNESLVYVLTEADA